jgi:hypothetical protein
LAQEPNGAVQFTMGNGLQCELRFSQYTKGQDAGFVQEVIGILEDWYRSADVLPIVQAIVPARLAGLDPEDLETGIGNAGDVLPSGEAERREWSRQWLAWDLAVSDAEWQELATYGIQPGDPRLTGSERNSQIKCRDESGEPYVPCAEK